MRNKNTYTLVTSFILCLTCLVSCTKNKHAKAPSPNVIIVITDDQGWGDLSIHRNPYLNSPHIDNFAEQGVRMNRFFVSPVCAPTRAALLSGKWGVRVGAWGVTRRKEVMRADTYTIAEGFKQAGYRTGIFGKWHNGPQYPENPKGQGFDTFLGFAAGHWNNYFNTTLQNNDGKMIKTEGYITDVLTDAAINFIKTHRNEPFFCYIPYNAPHGPFQVAEHYFAPYKAKGINDKDACIYGMCKNIDDNFGRILNTLDEEKLTENTIVIFMSDNGPNGIRYNGHMKGIKGSNDEGGTRVPFFIRWPEKIPAGKSIETIAAHIDVFPTLAKLCGIQIPDALSFDGKDISPLLLEDHVIMEDRYLYSHWSGMEWSDIPGSIRNQQYRLVLKREDTSLYDMMKDPYQNTDLFDASPEISEKMLQAYDSWIRDVYQDGMKTTPISIGYTAAQKTLIEAHEFTLGEGLAYHGKKGWANDWVTQWNSQEDTLSIAIEVKTEGYYDIEMLYNCDASQLGSEVAVRIQGEEIRKKLTNAFSGTQISSPDRIPRKEVYEKTWGTLSIGSLYLKPGMSTLNLYATKVAKDVVSEFKGVHIIFKPETSSARP